MALQTRSPERTQLCHPGIQNGCRLPEKGIASAVAPAVTKPVQPTRMRSEPYPTADKTTWDAEPQASHRFSNTECRFRQAASSRFGNTPAEAQALRLLPPRPMPLLACGIERTSRAQVGQGSGMRSLESGFVGGVFFFLETPGGCGS